MAERNGDVPGVLGSISVSFTQEIFAKMYSFVRLLWDFFLWYCSEILSAVKVLKKKKTKQVNQRLLEILHSLDCHREEECRVKGEVTAVSCWQLCFIMKLLLFVSWVRPSFAKQLILTKWHYSNIFLQKLKSLISFFHEEVLKCEIHIKVVVSNVCRILGSSLMKYSRSIGIMHHCLLGFIIQEIQGKVGMLCFFSRYMLGLSWLWLIMYFQYRAFFPPRKVV